MFVFGGPVTKSRSKLSESATGKSGRPRTTVEPVHPETGAAGTKATALEEALADLGFVVLSAAAGERALDRMRLAGLPLPAPVDSFFPPPQFTGRQRAVSSHGVRTRADLDEDPDAIGTEPKAPQRRE